MLSNGTLIHTFHVKSFGSMHGGGGGYGGGLSQLGDNDGTGNGK